MSGLDELLADLVELVYINAPHTASGLIPTDVAGFFEGPYYEWWNASKDEQGNWTYGGSQQSVTAVCDYIRLHGPFDGLWGFSQGGAMASILAAMQWQRAILTEVQPLRLCVVFAGIKSRDPVYGRYLDQPIRCPVVHVIGDKDYVKKYAYQLAECFQDPLIITHPRGHVIPRLEGEALAKLRAFLQAHQLPDSNL